MHMESYFEALPQWVHEVADMGFDTYLAVAKVETPGVATALESHKAPEEVGTVVDLVEDIAEVVSNNPKANLPPYLPVGYGHTAAYCRYSSAPG
jgi:hypothetical protein